MSIDYLLYYYASQFELARLGMYMHSKCFKYPIFLFKKNNSICPLIYYVNFDHKRGFRYLYSYT